MREAFLCRIFTRAVLVVLLPLLASQLLAGEQEIACIQMGELLPEHQGFLLTATGKPCFILRSGQEGEVSPPSAQKTAIFWPVLLRDILSAGSSVPGLPEARFLPVSGAYLLSKNDLLTPVDVPPLDVPPLDLPPLDLPPLPASRPDTSELARYLIPADADLAQKTELELQLKQLQATEQFLLSQSASSAVHELFRIYLTQAEGQLRVLVLTPVAVHQQQAIADRLAFTLLNAWLAWLEETEKQLYQPLQMAACGDGDDGDDPDATPLSIYFPDSSGPEFFQPLLLDKRLHKKLLRLQIVLAKLRWARACGNTELTKILDNRVMVLVADINDMGKLMTQSLGINGALGGALGEQSNPGADMELLADELTGYSLHPELIAEPVDSDNNPGSGKTAGKNGKASKASPVCTTRLVIFWDKNRKGAKGSGSGQPQSDRLCQHCLQHIAEHRVLTVTEKQVTVLQLCTYCFAQYSKNKKEVWVEPITCDGDPGNTPPSGKTMIKPADNNQLSDKIKDKDSGLISLLNEIFKPANRNSKPDSIWPPAEENSGSQENQNADNSIEVSNLDTVSKDKKEGSPDPGNSDEYVSNGGRGNRADNQDNVPPGIMRCARAVLYNHYEFNPAVDINGNFAISAPAFRRKEPILQTCRITGMIIRHLKDNHPGQGLYRQNLLVVKIFRSRVAENQKILSSNRLHLSGRAVPLLLPKLLPKLLPTVAGPITYLVSKVVIRARIFWVPHPQINIPVLQLVKFRNWHLLLRIQPVHLYQWMKIRDLSNLILLRKLRKKNRLRSSDMKC